MASEDATITGRALSDLPLISEFIAGVCERADVRHEARFDIQLAVEEACTNVIEHAYGGMGGEFVLRFQVSGGDVILTLSDRGRTFDPHRVPQPDLDIPLQDRPMGGLGLHLMRQLMDEVRFTFSPDGNTLVMVKRNVARRPGGLPTTR